jgi:hypothetical protein
MERLGCRAVDFRRNQIVGGDLIVLPRNGNGPVVKIPPREGTEIGEVEIAGCRWLSTMDSSVEAGFYMSYGFGPLPFAFGRAGLQRYSVVLIKDLSQ